MGAETENYEIAAKRFEIPFVPSEFPKFAVEFPKFAVEISDIAAGRDSDSATVCLRDINISSITQVETVLLIWNIPRFFPFQSISSFITTMTTGMEFSAIFTSISHNRSDNSFMVSAPTAATVLQLVFNNS